jgi:hypothetical protein
VKIITIHGDDWDIEYILKMLEDVKRDKLVSARWQPRDALVRADGSRATSTLGKTSTLRSMRSNGRFGITTIARFACGRSQNRMIWKRLTDTQMGTTGSARNVIEGLSKGMNWIR